MGFATLRSNTTVRLKNDEYRLLRKVTDALWQLEHTRTKRIQELTVKQLHAMFADGSLTIVANPIASKRQLTTAIPTAPEFTKAKMRRAYVLGVLNVPSTRSAMEKAIALVWDKLQEPPTPPGYITVYRWKKLYLQSGGDIRVLLDFTTGKGNRTPRYPSRVLELCTSAIERNYLTPERRTITSVVEDATLQVMRENDLLPSKLQLPLPTRRLIKRMIHDIPEFDKYAARFGNDAARRRFRFSLGKTMTDHPLQRAEIDHTLLDLFVVDDNTLLPMGRPWITACIDDFTRCVLGVYVGFTAPSYQTVALCLKDCFRPKTWLKQTFPEIKSDWPSFGVMSELVMDNGREFHGDSLEQACYSLGIQMTFAARREPWFKGKIERFLGTLNRSIAHGTPGTTFSNIIEKGNYNPQKHAVVKESTIQEIVRLWIADVYHQQVHSSLHTSPASMWASSIASDEICLPDDSTNLDVILGSFHEKVLTHKGIEYAGLLYDSPELQELRCQNGPRLDVTIRVDESNLGKLYVVYPPTGVAYPATAREHEYADGISLYQHKLFKKYQDEHLPDALGAEGWLQAKEYLVNLIARDFGLKRKKAHLNRARFNEHSKDRPVSTSQSKEILTIGSRVSELPAEEGSIQPPSPSLITSGSESIPRFEVRRKDNRND